MFFTNCSLIFVKVYKNNIILLFIQKSANLSWISGGLRGVKVEHLARVRPACRIVDKVVSDRGAVLGKIADRSEVVVVQVDRRDKDVDERLPELRIRGIPVAEAFEPERQLLARQLRLLALFVLNRVLQVNPPPLKFVEAGLRAGRDYSLLDGGDYIRDRALDIGELCLEAAENAVVLLAFLKVERRVHNDTDDVVVQDAPLKEPNDLLLDPVLLDWLLHAPALALPFCAGVIIEFFAAFARSAFADH